eukprot:15473405-Alexandrium_andersonii.AAC.1
MRFEGCAWLGSWAVCVLKSLIASVLCCAGCVLGACVLRADQRWKTQQCEIIFWVADWGHAPGGSCA